MPKYFDGETSSHGAPSHNLSTISKTYECSRRSTIPFFLNLSPLPSLSKLPVNRDELQSTMNATIATICNLLQTLLPQSKVITTIEYCKCKPYIAIKCCSYNNMTTQLCTIARLHCYNQMSRQCIATKL
jgi:hypothetical protein